MDIHFVMKDDLNVQINTNNRDYITAVDKTLTDYVKGYKFMPKYKRGGWSGKISLFNRPNRSLPYGLFLEVLRYTKLDWPELDYIIDNGVKDLFNGIDISKISYDLLFKPRPYQKEVIEALLKSSKGIAVVATAGGKSLIIAYIIECIREQFLNSQSLIIVPTLQLVDQFKGDLIEYGLGKADIGMVNAKKKEFNRDIVISTWQSLQNRMDELHRFKTVLCDEVHTAQATKISEILQSCTGAKFRYGVTGTLPTSRLDKLNVLSYLGPVLKEFRGKDLADLGYISKCTVNMMNIKYNDKITGDYHEIRDKVFTKEYRTGLIKDIISKTDNSVLILVEKVEKEGEVLEEMLKEAFPKKRVVFLSGRDSSEDRDDWRKEMDDYDDIICIATYPIFQAGINIKSLRTIILASPTKSFVRVIQSLGRVLRMHVNKALGGAFVWDICDNCKYLKDHASKRHRHYTKEGHTIKEVQLYEEDKHYLTG